MLSPRLGDFYSLLSLLQGRSGLVLLEWERYWHICASIDPCVDCSIIVEDMMFLSDILWLKIKGKINQVSLPTLADVHADHP